VTEDLRKMLLGFETTGHGYIHYSRIGGAQHLFGHALPLTQEKLMRVSFFNLRVCELLILRTMAQIGVTAHFSREFREDQAETPHQFLLRQRVERAKEMLRSADARVMDVAVACVQKPNSICADLPSRVRS